MASRWSRISEGILTGFRIGDRIRITPVMQYNYRGLGYPRRPPGVNSGTWACWGNVIWVRQGDPESWPGEDMDGNMIDPVNP
jgi:hypothetical protein